MDFNHTISIPKKPQAFHSLPNNWSNSLRLATISSLNINIISPSLNSIAINSSLANLPSQKLISKHPWNIDHHIVAQEAPRYSHWCTIWDVLAIISTHNRIYLFNSPANPEIDKWSTNCDLQPFISLPQNTLKSCCWSNHSTLPFLSTLLAIGSTSGHLVILSYQSMEMISQKLSIHLHNAWLTNILWSDWQLDQNNIQFAYILTGFADGTVSLCKIYNLNGDLSVLKLHDLALADNTPVSFLSFKDFEYTNSTNATNADQINIDSNKPDTSSSIVVAYAKSNRLFITAIGSQSTTDCYVAPFGTITHGIWYNKNHIRIYTANGIQLNLSYTTQPVSMSLVSDETAALRSFLSDGADNDNDSQDEDEDVNGDIDGFGPDKEEFQVYGVLASPHGLYDFISYRLTSFIYMAYLTDHQIKTNISIRPINHPVDTLCVLKTYLTNPSNFQSAPRKVFWELLLYDLQQKSYTINQQLARYNELLLGFYQMNKHLIEFVDVTNPPIPIRCLQYITYIYAVTQPHWNQDEMIDQVDVLTQHQQAIREFYWRGILTKLFAQYQSLNLSNQTLDGNNEYILACMWKSENIDVVELVDKLLPCLSNQTINNMKIIIESNFIQPCAICNEPITNQSPHQCIHHHTWKQCPLSLLLIDTPVIKTCSDCGLKYRWFQNQVFETQPITFLLMQLNTCVFCASTFKYSDLQLYR